jgi:hypothetical protein
VDWSAAVVTLLHSPDFQQPHTPTTKMAPVPGAGPLDRGAASSSVVAIVRRLELNHGRPAWTHSQILRWIAVSGNEAGIPWIVAIPKSCRASSLACVSRGNSET